MSEEISKLFLLSGEPYQINKNVYINHPKVLDIIGLGGSECDNLYWGYVNVLVSDPYSNMVLLDDMGRDWQKTSPFELFCIRWLALMQVYEATKDKCDGANVHPLSQIIDALNFFFGKRQYCLKVYPDANNEFRIEAFDDPNFSINDVEFSRVSEFVKAINCFDFSDHINPQSEFAKQELIKDERSRLKRLARSKKPIKQPQVLGELQTALVFGGNGGVTPFNVTALPIYALYKGAQTVYSKDTYNHVMGGVYAGTLKFSDIDAKILNWAK